MAYVAYTKQEGPTEADQWADTGWRVPRPSDPLPTADTDVSGTAAWRAVSAGVAAYRRYADSGDAAQLDAAVDAFTRAVASCPGDAPHFSHLNNLANALVDRFELRWEAEREEREAERELIRRKAGDAAKRAAAPIAPLELFGNQPHFAKLNKRLEAEYAERVAKRELAKREVHEAKRELADWEARWAARASDLDDALHYAHWAVWTRSGDSPDAARALATLRRVQRQREASMVLPKRGPRLEYVNERLAAMTCAPVADRVAALWHVSGGRPSFETSLEAIVETLPRTVAWIGPRGQVREPAQPTADMLDTLIRLALYKSDTTLAVELFEAGRGVLWDRLIGHSAQTVTRAKAPALARRLERAARGLDEHGGLPGLAHMAAPQRSDRKERRADARLKRRRARQQRVWDSASRKVPSVLRREAAQHDTGRPEATFLLPNYAQEILPAAAEGPIIAVLRQDYQILALIVQEGHEAPVCLEVGSAWGFDKTMKKYLLALDDVSSETREQTVRETLEQFHRMFRALPWYLFGNDFDPAAADGPPRVWWCPSGLLSMLPLHAAASFPHEGKDFVPGPEIKIPRAGGARDTWKPDASARQRITDSSCLLDTMVSSYTPTIRSLVWAREVRDAEPAADPAQDPRMMLVESNSDSILESLPGSQGVRTHLQKLLPQDRLTLLAGRDATVRRVTREFHHHDAAHFDCHSLRDPDDPWRSGLSLHDRPLTVEDLIERRVDRLDFAYLAACATALTDEQVPDEMITLTAALHYTGCPHVIGTLTPSTDRSTARVTRSLYSSLVREDGLLDPTDCARLLHAAVGAERARMPDRPSAWSPFIHIGI